MKGWERDHLINLLQMRYEDWQDFTHPAFLQDEILPKRQQAEKVQALLAQAWLDAQIAAGNHTAVLEHLEKACQGSNLLWRRVPSSGDTAVLHHPAANNPQFVVQIRNLLHGDQPAPVRLQTFANYAQQHDMPNKWPLPTYLLFMCHPAHDIFIKPQPGNWLLKFMGSSSRVTSPPTRAVYQQILAQAQQLLETLRPLGAADMIDVQSVIWVGMRESRQRVTGLSQRGQIDLDVPPSVPEPLTYAPSRPAVMVREANNEPAYHTTQPKYELAQCAADTGYDVPTLQRWLQAIERKGQAIFYGPPGTGKTFLAQKLARHLASGGDGFDELVQFHPAYAYEDFVEGIRPFTNNDGTITYKTVPGRFLNFCQQAAACQDICVLIIDEINRANLASVLGELMYLLEYREETLTLAGGRPFQIPANVRLIATMNTADRSIALIDHALRRRFAFIQLQPNMDIIANYHAHSGYDPAGLISVLQQLNQVIADPHYAIGHSFFLQPNLPTILPDIWQMEIEPYLEEYFFDTADKIAPFRWQKVTHHLLPEK